MANEAWVIEWRDGDNRLWFYTPISNWTENSIGALRFSREEDAQAFASSKLQSHAYQIVRHVWE